MPMRNARRDRCMPTPTHARIDLEEGESDRILSEEERAAFVCALDADQAATPGTG